MKRILITGAAGFIGKNLALRLSEYPSIQVLEYTREDPFGLISKILPDVDIVFHLAGVNRSKNISEFNEVNVQLTAHIVELIAKERVENNKSISVVYASSTQVILDSPYGESKRRAEEYLFWLKKEMNLPVYILRLPNIFGKWSRPNYNSVVATFCYNIARDLPIQINDPTTSIKLVYIDDVISQFINIIEDRVVSPEVGHFVSIGPEYDITLSVLADQINSFKTSRNNLTIDRVGFGLTRALYSTYVSYLPLEDFSYAIPQYSDDRGIFVEMLKTKDSGQISFFTTLPGVTRGGHFHHSKTEKFLVIKGRALFRFKHALTAEYNEIYVTGDFPQIVETIPGWVHDITNVGQEDMVVMLWANEVFDKCRPDTFKSSLLKINDSQII